MTLSNLLRSIRLEADYACFNRRRSLRFAHEGNAAVYQQPGWLELTDSSAPEDTYINRVIVTQTLKANDLQEVLQRYKEQGLALSLDVLPHAVDEHLASALITQGFRPVRELLFLEMQPQAPGVDPKIHPRLSIKRIQAGEGVLFLEAVIASMGRTIAPDIIQRKKPFYEKAPFLCYLAYLDQELAGLATLYLAGDQAWLANAYTFEAFRGRGVQSALIQSRMHDAQRHGVQSLLTDVEFLSPSFRNLQRCGFQFHYAATTWERPLGK